MSFEDKYLKYKKKYVNLKGGNPETNDELLYDLEIDLQYNLLNMLSESICKPTIYIDGLIKEYEIIFDKLKLQEISNNIKYLNEQKQQLKNTSYCSIECNKKLLHNGLFKIPDIKKMLDIICDYSNNIKLYDEFDNLTPMQQKMVIKDCLDDDDEKTLNITEILEGGGRKRRNKRHTNSFFYTLMMMFITMISSIMPDDTTYANSVAKVNSQISKISSEISKIDKYILTSLPSEKWYNTLNRNIYNNIKTAILTGDAQRKDDYTYTTLFSGDGIKYYAECATWTGINFFIGEFLRGFGAVNRFINTSQNNKTKLLIYYTINNIVVPFIVNYVKLTTELYIDNVEFKSQYTSTIVHLGVSYCMPMALNMVLYTKTASLFNEKNIYNFNSLNIPAVVNHILSQMLMTDSLDPSIQNNITIFGKFTLYDTFPITAYNPLVLK